MKKIRLIALLLIALVVLSAKSSVAQDSTFKLSDYKNPNYFYQALDLNFGLNSGFMINNVNTTDKLESNSFSLNSSVGAAYSLYINSPKTQTELRSTFNVGIGSFTNNAIYSDNTYASESNNFNHSENLNFFGLKRFFSEKQNYFEVNGSVKCNNYFSTASGNRKTSGTITYQSEDERKQLDLNMALALLVGKGRIEQVQDARLAMYILDDLQKLSRENRLASNEDVLALARVITSLKYKRFFDDRLRKIAEITVIDSFLQKNNISGATDATYFTSLNDNWNYANNPVRYSGRRLFTGIEANYGYNYEYRYNEVIDPSVNYTKTTEHQSPAGLFVVAGINCEKPVSLRWQKSSYLKIGVGMQQQVEYQKVSYPNSATETNYYVGSVPSLKIDASYGFGYYPTSRTWLTFNWWLMSAWANEMDGDSRQEKEDFQNRFYGNTGPRFNAYYYISEKLRLSLSFIGQFGFDNIKYTYEVTESNPKKTTRTLWDQEVRATLNYSLF